MCVARDALHRRHLAEGVIEHVAPVAEHVGDDPAAVFRAVVPRRTLRGLPAPVALEHPVAELAAHAEDAAEEAGVDEPLELADARQEQLVLHDAVLHARLVGEPREIERLLRAHGERLLAVDVLPALDRAAHVRRAKLRQRRVEVDRIVLVRERLLEIRRDTDRCRTASASARSLRSSRPTRIGSGISRVPSGIGTPPCCADRDDRAHEVLVEAHASRDAVHDDADAVPADMCDAVCVECVECACTYV